MKDEYRWGFSGLRVARECLPRTTHKRMPSGQKGWTAENERVAFSSYVHARVELLLRRICRASSTKKLLLFGSILGYVTRASSIMPAPALAFVHQVPTDPLPSSLRFANKIFEERGIPDGGHSSRAPENCGRQRQRSHRHHHICDKAMQASLFL